MKPTCITCKADCHNAGTTSRIVDCSQYKPGRILTNADRCAYPNIPIYEGCRQAALKWMKQPVEVDT